MYMYFLTTQKFWELLCRLVGHSLHHWAHYWAHYWAHCRAHHWHCIYWGGTQNTYTISTVCIPMLYLVVSLATLLTSSKTGLLVPFWVLVCWMSLPQPTFTTGFKPLPTSLRASRTCTRTWKSVGLLGSLWRCPPFLLRRALCRLLVHDYTIT